MFREHGDRPGLWAALSHLGALALLAGDVPAARRAEEEEVELQRLIGSHLHLAWCLVSVAEVVRQGGEDPSALLDEARELFIYTGRADGVAACDEMRL
jgi:hypothetical protein